MAKRRANGEGTIRKRADGRWEGMYTVGKNPETGKQIFKNVLGKTQKEVKDKLKKAIEESKNVDFVKSDKYTVGSWLDVWYENYALIKVRPSSHSTYKGYIENHIKPNIGKIKLNKLTSLDLQKLYKKLLESGRVDRIESRNQPKGLSVKTVRNINQIISSALDVAVTEKLISMNVAKSCALPKQEQKEMHTLTQSQLNQLFAEADKSGVFELYYLDLATGLRRGELLGLKWENIDFENKTITVRQQVMRIDGKTIEAPLKTKNAYRTISIGDDVIEVLKKQKAKEKGEFVFHNKKGEPISPDSVNNMLSRVLKRAGLPKIRFHDLRHTFATLALQNGVDVKTVSGMLGHFSAGFTLDTYTHVTTESQVKAANTMSSILTSVIR